MSSENWQPIETAPKDGTRVLVFSPVDGVVSSHWEGGTWQGLPWRAPHNAAKAAPTHWMPIPPPPGPSKGIDPFSELRSVSGDLRHSAQHDDLKDWARNFMRSLADRIDGAIPSLPALNAGTRAPDMELTSGEAARIDSDRIDAIERLQVAITPVEGGGWDASVFDHDNERLIFSGRDVRAAIDGALTALAGQQGAMPE